MFHACFQQVLYLVLSIDGVGVCRGVCMYHVCFQQVPHVVLSPPVCVGACRRACMLHRC